MLIENQILFLGSFLGVNIFFLLFSLNKPIIVEEDEFIFKFFLYSFFIQPLFTKTFSLFFVSKGVITSKPG